MRWNLIGRQNFEGVVAVDAFWERGLQCCVASFRVIAGSKRGNIGPKIHILIPKFYNHVL